MQLKRKIYIFFDVWFMDIVPIKRLSHSKYETSPFFQVTIFDKDLHILGAATLETST